MKCIFLFIVLAICLPLAAYSQRVADKKFIALNGAQYLMGLADTFTTQDCMRRGTCMETNPWMPKSAWGQFGVITGISAAGTFTSYKLKQNHSKLWVMIPYIGIVGHTAGIASGVRYGAEWRFALP